MDVKLPDGTIVKNIPDNITKAELTAKLNANGYSLPTDNALSQSQTEQPKSYSTMGAIGTGALNLIPSTGKLLVNAAKGIAHPVNALEGAIQLGSGALSKVLPESIMQYAIPEKRQQAEQVANAEGQSLYNKLGTYENFKRSFAEDPASILSDISAFTGGGGALLKGATTGGKIAELGKALSKTSEITNPLNLAAKEMQAVTYPFRELGKGTIGTTTTVGKMPVEEAIKAGEQNAFTGNNTYIKNINNPQSTDALDIAKQSLNKIKQEKNQQYRSGMVDITNDKSVLNFDKIDNGLQDAFEKVSFKGQARDEYALDKISKAQDEISKWKNLNPAEYHTPEGMDALKQKIGSILETIPYEQRTARSAIQDVYHSVKKSITDQAPVYSDVMQKYSEASDLIDEIKKGLSLGENASADTAMRKLQSVMRNNVNTNYGQRMKLVDELKKAGGEDIMPALAGQTMSSWKPRGLGGQLETYGGLLAALHNPAVLLAAPLLSPRLMGNALYKYGQAKGYIKKGLNKLPGTTTQKEQLVNVLSQMNQNKEQQ